MLYHVPFMGVYVAFSDFTLSFLYCDEYLSQIAPSNSLFKPNKVFYSFGKVTSYN
jgi:hypothetical protein